jgi:hypothetical protein
MRQSRAKPEREGVETRDEAPQKEDDRIVRTLWRHREYNRKVISFVENLTLWKFGI